MKGRLTTITGPMSSGKTAALIEIAVRSNIANRKALIVKPKFDTRNPEGFIESRSGAKIAATVLPDDMQIVDKTSYQLICFDEVHFYEQDKKDKFIWLINELLFDGIGVVVSGLDMDYKGKPFGLMAHLLAIADDVQKLKAVCVKCGEDASMTLRISSGKERFLCGGDDKYAAVCRNCHKS